MAKKVIIVGGVAGGASAAARARRLCEESEIIVFEKDRFISFANCGLPYHIGGKIQDRNALLVQTPESMRARFNLDIRTETEVIAIHPDIKKVKVRDLQTGHEYQESYTHLILSPGASPIVPAIPGANHARVFALRNIPDMDRIIHCIEQQLPKRVAVIGGGYIGLEVAEAMIDRGLETHLIELSNQVMGSIDPEMATPLHLELRKQGVELHLKTSLTGIEEITEGLSLQLNDNRKLAVDMVVMAIGVKPNVALAKQAGLAIGAKGGIVVDAKMQTSNPSIYAVGDAIEVKNFVSQDPAIIPLAGPANRQGRIAADQIFDRDSRYKDSLGTGICKVFDLDAAATGLNEKQLVQTGRTYEKIYVHPGDHAGYYPGATRVSLKLLFDPENGTILGAQAVGQKGVDKRIDILAMAIRGGTTVFDLEEQELCYAPPYGSAKDVINQAGFVASNVVRGDQHICHAERVRTCSQNMQLIDVRNPEEIGELGTIEDAWNIPVGHLRHKLDLLPKDKDIVVFCEVGLRGYVAYRMLKNAGFNCKNLSGGYYTYSLFQGILK